MNQWKKQQTQRTNHINEPTNKSNLDPLWLSETHIHPCCEVLKIDQPLPMPVGKVFQKHPADALRESFALMGFRHRHEGDWLGDQPPTSPTSEMETGLQPSWKDWKKVKTSLQIWKKCSCWKGDKSDPAFGKIGKCVVMMLRSSVSVEEVSLVYRRMCLRGHPSRGGSPKDYLKLQAVGSGHQRRLLEKATLTSFRRCFPSDFCCHPDLYRNSDDLAIASIPEGSMWHLH